jgi:hypothetical protein
MKDYPDQTPELRDALLAASPLNARLGGRLTQSVGVIDVKRIERHHARLTQWLAARYALLGRFQTRYGSQEIPTVGNTLVMQQALQEQSNIFNEVASQIAAHAPPPVSAAPTPPARQTSATPMPETNDPSPPQGKLRLSRRPPTARSPQSQTADATGASSVSQIASPASPNALPVSANAPSGANAANESERASKSRTPASAPTPVDVVRAVEETSTAPLRRAAALDLPLTSRTGERAGVEAQPATRAIKPDDATIEARERDSSASNETMRAASSLPAAPPQVSGLDAGGELILRQTSASDAGEKVSATTQTQFKTNTQRETMRAGVSSTVAAQTSELTLNSGIPSASEIPLTPEISRKNRAFVLRDDAPAKAPARSPVAIELMEASSVAKQSAQSKPASEADISSTLPLVRQPAAQSQNADVRASFPTPAQNVSFIPNAGNRNVAFEIQESATPALAPLIVRRQVEAAKAGSFSSGEADGETLYGTPRQSNAASGSASGKQPTAQSQKILPASAAEAQGAQVDIGRITEQVIRALSRRMSVERERRGLRR